MSKKIDSAEFRQILGCFTTGVAVVTAQNDALGEFGLTVNSFTSVSLAPPLVLFCLDRDAALHKAFRQVDCFVINFLAAGQEKVSRHFADSHHNPAPKNMWDAGVGGCPVLRGTLGWVLCKPHAVHKGGDHSIFVGEVIDLHKRAGTKEPLAYFHGRYRALEALAVGKLTSGARK